MAVSFLDFEQPIAELEAKIEELGHVTADDKVNIEDEIAKLRAKSRALTRSIFSNLTPWQITQIARHPQRPYTLDYIGAIFSDFQELHGDRMYADDTAIVGGLARFEGATVMVIGHQKGRDTKERVRRNYGMPKPEGYRKALRLMKLAERFGLARYPYKSKRREKFLRAVSTLDGKPILGERYRLRTMLRESQDGTDFVLVARREPTDQLPLFR